MSALHKRASIVGQAVAALIRQRLKTQAPPLAREQRRAWIAGARALSDAQLDAVLDARGLTPDVQAQLAAGVADFVNGPLTDRWRASLRAGGRVLDSSFELLSRERVDAWIARESANLIAQQTEQQRRAVKSLLQANVQGDRATLTAALRATVGLTERQARALSALASATAEDGLDPARRRALLERAASRSQAVRAERIARTELAHAYNGGVDEAIKGGLDSGTFVDAQKTWRTQRDERECPICAPLDRLTVPVGESFEGRYDVPPAHPNCRCVLLYSVE